MKTIFPELFDQSVTERAIQLLRNLWADSVATGSARVFNIDNVKQEARRFLDNYKMQGENPVLPEPLSPISLIEIWLEKAIDDISEADKALDRINEVIEQLSRKPFLGHSQSQMSNGMMSYPIGSYLLFYRELAEGGVELIRLTHGVPASEDTYLGKALRHMLYKDS